MCEPYLKTNIEGRKMAVSKNGNLTQNPTRRNRLIGGAAAAGGLAASLLPSTAQAAQPAASSGASKTRGQHSGNYISTKDGTQLYYKDWGTGRPVVFCHGWPLSSDSWESQMMLAASYGFRAVAHDRRGHGRSSQPWNGNEMDTYADDLATVFETLGLRDPHNTLAPARARSYGSALTQDPLRRCGTLAP
jgi:non-heme chloroperoxidase